MNVKKGHLDASLSRGEPRGNSVQQLPDPLQCRGPFDEFFVREKLCVFSDPWMGRCRGCILLRLVSSQGEDVVVPSWPPPRALRDGVLAGFRIGLIE